MSLENVLGSEALSLAKDLVREIEQGDGEKAQEIIGRLAQKNDSLLLQEIGRLTRELHTALNGFNLDSQLSGIGEEDFSDARERLHYVISLTDQAANSTLNAIEEAVPLCDQLHGSVQEIRESWERFLGREMNAEEFRVFSRQLKGYLGEWDEQIAAIKQHLNDILMAQDFQDLTGQVLHRVIELVENLESNLVGLIRVAGGGTRKNEKKEGPDIEATGPKVPGVDKWDTVSSQGEVDDLLSSLGF